MKTNYEQQQQQAEDKAIKWWNEKHKTSKVRNYKTLGLVDVEELEDAHFGIKPTDFKKMQKIRENSTSKRGYDILKMEEDIFGTCSREVVERYSKC